MSKCVNCASTRSPDEARFCVDCGYALRQRCAYNDCGCEAVPLKVADVPTVRCSVEGGCLRYFRFCPNCHRLHRLDERTCRTERCKAHPLREPFAGFEGVLGDETRGASVEVPAAWERSKSVIFEGQLTLPAALGGLAFRYGSLYFSGENGFASVKANRRCRARLDDRAAQENHVPLPAHPLSSGALLPHPHALRVAHGNAYILSEAGPLRVALATEEVQTASPDVWQAVQEGESEGWGDWPANEGDGFGANPFGDSDATAMEVPAPLDVSAVRWRMQTATPSHWFGLGAEGKRLCLVQSSNSALFEVSRVALPEEIGVGDVMDIMPLGEDVLLLLREALWRWRGEKWEVAWCGKGDFPLKGALQYGGDLLLWGWESDDLTLQRLDGSTLQTVGQPLSFKARDVYAQPVRLGEELFFFDHTRNDHAIVACNPQQPLLAPQRIPFVSDSRAVWAAGAECEGRAWLVYALDNGTDVEFYVKPVAPKIESDWPLGSKLRLRRDSRGGTLAAVIADGHLAIAAATSEGAALHLFDMGGVSNIVS